MKLKLRFWAGILFSVIGTVLTIRATNLAEAWAALGQINYYPILVALAALGVTLAAKALRWRLLFDLPNGYPPLAKVFSVLVIGQMFNLVLPLRMGEVARAYYIGEMAGINKSLAISTVIVEKLVDMLAVLLLVVLLLPSVPFPPWLQGPVFSLAVVAVILFLSLILIAWHRTLLSSLLARFLGILPSALKPQFIQSQIEKALDGLRALRQARMLPVLLLTAASWLFSAVTNHFVFLALGVSLPFTASFFVLVILQVGVAVPTGPGRIGVFQYLTILALAVFAVTTDKALAIGIVLYLLVHIPPIVLGLFFLWRYHLGLWRPQAVPEES
ncbi:MAG: lysylphosphatidylglycerol synthase transmembrane domain-containing protein [Dehalococcoidia bacterium]|nr:lysylphosphatidylglycerol synthase transmembrane domain-containing protein [Dehalococcoidia bacterium]